MSTEEKGSRLSPNDSTASNMLFFIVWLVRAVFDRKHWKATIWFLGIVKCVFFAID